MRLMLADTLLRTTVSKSTLKIMIRGQNKLKTKLSKNIYIPTISQSSQILHFPFNSFCLFNFFPPSLPLPDSLRPFALLHFLTLFPCFLTFQGGVTIHWISWAFGDGWSNWSNNLQGRNHDQMTWRGPRRPTDKYTNTDTDGWTNGLADAKA